MATLLFGIRSRLEIQQSLGGTFIYVWWIKKDFFKSFGRVHQIWLKTCFYKDMCVHIIELWKNTFDATEMFIIQQ